MSIEIDFIETATEMVALVPVSPSCEVKENEESPTVCVAFTVWYLLSA